MARERTTTEEKPVTVKMTRSPFDYEGATAPFEADVHPDEVDNYAAYGWKIAGGK